MKLISLNIEGQKHLDKVRGLIEREDPDVLCLAECFPDTIEYLAGAGYIYQLFVPTYMVDQDETGLFASSKRRWGEAILSKHPLTKSQITYLTMDEYSETNLPTHGTDNHIPALLLTTVNIGKEAYRLGSIHLTWTPKARMTKRQRINVAELIDLVKDEEIVLAGDFNIPRGNAVYKKLAAIYLDNILASVVTTIDPKLHYRNTKKHGELQLVVDYVWSTPKYKVGEVRVVSGVSDHCAIICDVAKN